MLEHPRTEALRSRFPKAQLVLIDHQRELTQQRSATWSEQKLSAKLVVAQKSPPHIYSVGDVAPGFGHRDFAYAVPMQNCLYDCEYCYLQGMYTSAHLTVFVNQEEMQAEARQRAEESGDLYLCLAYDNDLLAFEGVLPLTADWLRASVGTPSLTIEVRTKSANFPALKGVEPNPRAFLAWTLSPEGVIRRFEPKTPPLRARLRAMESALNSGWRVRLCFDPLLPISDWQREYGDLLKELDERDLWSRVEDVSYGIFRMNRDYLRQARRARPDSELLMSATRQEERGLFTLAQSEQRTLKDWFAGQLHQRLPREKVWAT